ncbi:MAG: hypothetical protein A3G97_02500 [Candidatus Rokubacteria bacterium RIFCSPLOWO2_12_FULL_69_21]|nr:MAG: hypothetical protein A3J45_15610 [Candidatus Rokubacteria bacterium RIFCSPHIGHO2_02_FULL_69_13]OGL22847.1 MAG: hypothetical protein A3G97_02500 [Candidatus Rokubacteria bacterium RIFCSPLOWO2_12_FULL_69_21]
MRPLGLPADRRSPFVEIVLGLLLLGGLTLLFLPAYSPLALAFVALVALRHGAREALAAAVCAWGLLLALALARPRGPGMAILRATETYVILCLLLAGGIGFGAIGLAHRRALHGLRDRVNELELELADQGVRLLVAIEEKQELEQRLAQERSPGSRP